MSNKCFIKVTVFKVETDDIVEEYVINYNDKQTDRPRYLKTFHGVLKNKKLGIETSVVDKPSDAP